MDGVRSMKAVRVAVAGEAMGPALVTDEPLSFWGGVDPNSGEIIDQHHPLRGASLAGRVLALPHGRGSCSASGVLLEAIVNGAGPAAILTTRVDPILGLGSILAEELHGRSIPVLVLAADDFASLRTGDRIAIDRAGRLQVGSIA